MQDGRLSPRQLEQAPRPFDLKRRDSSGATLRGLGCTGWVFNDTQPLAHVVYRCTPIAGVFNG